MSRGKRQRSAVSTPWPACKGGRKTRCGGGFKRSINATAFRKAHAVVDLLITSQ